jgi:hypothetical protein
MRPRNIDLCRRALEHDVVKIFDSGLAKRLASGAGPEGGAPPAPRPCASRDPLPWRGTARSGGCYPSVAGQLCAAARQGTRGGISKLGTVKGET